MRTILAVPSAVPSAWPMLAVAVAVAVLLPAAPAAAIGQLADITIVDRASGRSLPLYRHGGQWWVAGRPGARYAISIRNQSGARILAVTAVDGVNAVSGETAGWQQTGYVLDGWQRHDVAGWRKSDAEIAAFEFTSLNDAYASRTGRPGNVGVIGVALFRERVDAALPLPVAPRSRLEKPAQAQAAQQEPGSASAEAPAEAASAPPAPGPAAPRAEARDRAAAPGALTMPAPRREPRLGTGHGQREISHVVHTRFERLHSQPDEIVAIRYDSDANLVAMGVIRLPSKPPGTAPDAFPASARAGYVPDPPL